MFAISTYLTPPKEIIAAFDAKSLPDTMLSRYTALKGHGATVRYVTLPAEAHGYASRETLLGVLAERINWFDKYVKNAPHQVASAP